MSSKKGSVAKRNKGQLNVRWRCNGRGTPRIEGTCPLCGRPARPELRT